MDPGFLIDRAVAEIRAWEATWGPYDHHPSVSVSADRAAEALLAYTDRLKDNYPFFHPRYAGQMLKPPHPAAVAAYVAAMLINPNNHALDGGPATAAMEMEVIRQLRDLVGLPEPGLGHLTSSGTIANLEALWVARELRPGKVVAFSAEAHYTHGRMAGVLGVETRTVPTDASGHMDLEALERALQDGQVGTVVATAGTTGIGAVDPVADILPMVQRHGVRLHVDAAYGGFFRLLAGPDVPLLGAGTRRHLDAISGADSVVVDPHKHGLQPYGCGAVLFRDPKVGRFYRHDSPYTYFTSADLHLGEISLECSRAGASAGALWLTLRLLPLRPDEGLGPVLAACVRAAQDWHRRLVDSTELDPLCAPELDIVAFHPRVDPPRAAAVDQASRALFRAAMEDEDDPVFLSLYRVPAKRISVAGHPVRRDRADVQVLRSVLMKPEHELYVPRLHRRVETLAASLRHQVAD
jgi:glutamate/tyrosine decarboxylase-like PLP-dependent enzyme